MRNLFITILCLFIFYSGKAQVPFNITVTNPVADSVLKGNFNPADFISDAPMDDPVRIVCEMQEKVSTDSLFSYLLTLSSFHNRNTYADTVSGTTGIGAARRWVYSMFQKFSAENENRLIPSYMEFEFGSNALCGAGVFRNIFAVLPGTDTSDKSIVLIEAHIDSRCEDVCDINCLAHGADDNGSGTALVMELARVFSQFSFKRTLVFMATVGEEQGLYGATAFAQYAQDNGIAIRAVQNNDIVGGIICGETSSPPSCPMVYHIDSTQVRIFSFGNNNSPNKGYARFIKMLYHEWLLPVSTVPMTVSIMQPEDRTGRGGDHIPFRQRGYTAVRFSSANEHGHGNPSAPGYNDHQHTTKDIIGADTNGDTFIDSFFVDFNYLKRNTLINGVSAAMAAIGPETPSISVNTTGAYPVVEITDASKRHHYRIGIRTAIPDFEAAYTLTGDTSFVIPGLQQGTTYRVSVASVDSSGVMSLFSNEVAFTSNANTAALPADTIIYKNMSCIETGITDEQKFSAAAKQKHPPPGAVFH